MLDENDFLEFLIADPATQQYRDFIWRVWRTEDG